MNFDLQLWALHINFYLNISKAFVTRANFHEGEILQKKIDMAFSNHAGSDDSDEDYDEE